MNVKYKNVFFLKKFQISDILTIAKIRISPQKRFPGFEKLFIYAILRQVPDFIKFTGNINCENDDHRNNITDVIQ